MVDFTDAEWAPVLAAVETGDVRLVRLLLLGPLGDVNRGRVRVVDR